MSHRIRPLFDLLEKAQRYWDYGVDLYNQGQQHSCEFRRVDHALELVSNQIKARGFDPSMACHGQLYRMEEQQNLPF